MAMQVCCCVCWDVYDPQAPAKQPRTLPCGHSVCTGCLCRLYQPPLQPPSWSCPTCRYPLPGDQNTCFSRNFALEDALAHLNEQQCKARAAIKEARQELCRMTGALKDSKAKVATGKAIYSGLNQLHNQALKREADLKAQLTEAKGQAEAVEKKLALAEAKLRNSDSLRKLQMRHSQANLSNLPRSLGIAGQLRQLADRPAQSSIGLGQQYDSSGVHANFPDLQQQLSRAETSLQKHHAAACQHEYEIMWLKKMLGKAESHADIHQSRIQNQMSSSYTADASSALLPSTSHSCFEPPVHPPLLPAKSLSKGLCSLTKMPDADHKDLTSKIATCHSRPDTPRHASRKRAFISMSTDDEADISLSASDEKENGPIGRRLRTAIELPSKDYSH